MNSASKRATSTIGLERRNSFSLVPSSMALRRVNRVETGPIPRNCKDCFWSSRNRVEQKGQTEQKAEISARTELKSKSNRMLERRAVTAEYGGSRLFDLGSIGERSASYRADLWNYRLYECESWTLGSRHIYLGVQLQVETSKSRGGFDVHSINNRSPMSKLPRSLFLHPLRVRLLRDGHHPALPHKRDVLLNLALALARGG